MSAHDEDRMKQLLKAALPKVQTDAGPERDLWPATLRRLDQETAAGTASGRAGWDFAWFDGVLAAGLLLLVASFPAAIPLLLYYL